MAAPISAEASTAHHLRYWLGRFQAHRQVDGSFVARDWLQPASRTVAASVLAGLQGKALDRTLFQHGFAHAAYSVVGAGPVGERPDHRHDILFWQFPCRTEGAAWEAHATLPCPALDGGGLHVYLGLPWATWIDKARKQAWGPAGEDGMRRQLRLLGVRLSGLRHALAQLGVQLRVHTVCQHIYWQDMVGAWKALGVTDVWLSHCPATGAVPTGVAPLALHPWALFAVNVEDPERRRGLEPGKDVAARPLLASFMGAHAPHYLGPGRLHLRAIAGEQGFVVRVTDRWHFEDVVYDHQIAGGPAPRSPVQGEQDDAVWCYNRLLTDSVFALCPAGAGPNTLRLWEALAVGAVPVLIGPPPELPRGGSLAPKEIDWDAIVLRSGDDPASIAALPGRLRAVPLEERRQRQRLGMEAYGRVRGLRCFGKLLE